MNLQLLFPDIIHINAVDSYGDTPLHCAIKSCIWYTHIDSLPMIQQLLYHPEMNINIQNSRGQRPFGYCS
jgi:ankyrin repeat protein